jgi:hypothetical protein
MSDHAPKINLIYVASIGRSGTTLFETMLGAHSQVETIGEVHLWPHEILQGGVRPCGSGLYVHECPFWTAMRERVTPLEQPAPRLHFFREQHDAGRTLRPERLRDFTTRPLPNETANAVETYGDNNYDLFSAFLDLVEDRTGTRPDWIVDASKDPYRLLWLLRSGRFNLKVFHLVKHPCGFAYSVTRNWIGQLGWQSHLTRLYYTARQSGAWVTQNLLFSLITRNHLSNADYELIRYEDLASKPRETFRRACACVGLPYEEAAVSDWRSGSRFTIAGNPMRYEDRDIELDERWKQHLPLTSRILTSLITAVNKSSYQY